MGFNLVPLTIMVFSLILLLTGAWILLRQQWLLPWLKGTGGLLLVGVAVYASLFALNLYSFQPLERDRALATVSFREVEPQEFVANVSQPDGSSYDYPLRGDLWQIDVRVAIWKGIFALFGATPGYQLDSIQGRYLSLEDDRSKERTRHQIHREGIGFDIWARAREHGSMVLEPRRGRAAFLPMADGAIFEVVLSSSGLSGRPLNGIAERAISAWE